MGFDVNYLLKMINVKSNQRDPILIYFLMYIFLDPKSLAKKNGALEWVFGLDIKKNFSHKEVAAYNSVTLCDLHRLLQCLHLIFPLGE